jgi:hypothetical protein
VLALAFGTLALCAHVAVVYKGPGLRMLLLLIPALAGLALVYYLYQKEFFLSAAAIGLSVVGLWFVRISAAGVESVLMAVGVVVLGALALWLKKRDGALTSALRLLPKRAGYSVILASCLAALLALAAAMVLGASAAYYLLFVMIAWLFALLVYYTVKLM